MILLVIVASWGYILLSSDEKLELLPKLTGCYQAPGQPHIVISADSVLHFAQETVKVSPYRDKEGVALLPQKGLYVDSDDHNRLTLDSSVLLVRFNNDLTSFDVPDYRRGPYVRFTRSHCA